MPSDDEELIELFRIESAERLQRLDEGLLRLEGSRHDPETLREVFREAHSLKGAARLLGASRLERVAHCFEDLLSDSSQGTTALNSETIDRLTTGVDALRSLVDEVVTGRVSSVDPEVVLSQLAGRSQRSEQALTQPAASSVELARPPAPAESPPAPGQNAPGQNELHIGGADPSQQSTKQRQRRRSKPPVDAAASGESSSIAAGKESGGSHSTPAGRETEKPALLPAANDSVNGLQPAIQETSLETVFVRGAETQASFKVDTIRVEPQKLDHLMMQAGELAVTKLRIARRLGDLDEIMAFCEEWTKDALGYRLTAAGAFSDAQNSRTGRKLVNPQAGPRAHLMERERERLERLSALLDRTKAAAYEDDARLSFVTDQLEEGIRNIRLLPLSTIFSLFPRMVRDMARDQGKEVDFRVSGAETTADKQIIEELKDPLMHMIRNAVDHGIEAPEERRGAGKPRVAQLRLNAFRTATNIVIEVMDDGRGIDLEAVKQTAVRRRLHRPEELEAMSSTEVRALIFAPGFSTRDIITDVSGRGVGLDVVRKSIEQLKGSIDVESAAGRGCLMRLQLPVTLAAARVLLAAVGAEMYAIPVEAVETTRLVSRSDIFPVQGCDTVLLDGRSVSVAPLSSLLETRSNSVGSAEDGRPRAPAVEQWPCVFLALGDERLGLLVDGLLDEQEVVLKPLGALLKRVRNVSGATILGTGAVCLVLNPHDLVKTVRKRATSGTIAKLPAATSGKHVILLVEDSVTTRTLEKRILETAGYEVVTAVDGVEGLQKLSSGVFDAVVTDIEMPRMDGLVLTTRIREDKQHINLPIILVSSLASEEHRRKGAEAGANAYITKPTFDQRVLLETLERLI